jgi:hypothetical protein
LKHGLCGSAFKKKAKILSHSQKGTRGKFLATTKKELDEIFLKSNNAPGTEPT